MIFWVDGAKCALVWVRRRMWMRSWANLDVIDCFATDHAPAHRSREGWRNASSRLPRVGNGSALVPERSARRASDTGRSDRSDEHQPPAYIWHPGANLKPGWTWTLMRWPPSATRTCIPGRAGRLTKGCKSTASSGGWCCAVRRLMRMDRSWPKKVGAKDTIIRCARIAPVKMEHSFY